MYCGAALEAVVSVPSGDRSGTEVGRVFSEKAEEQAYIRSTPETETDTPGGETEIPFKLPFGTSIEDASLQLSLAKSKRRKPLGKVTLALLFFASAFIVGFIIWLMG
jgi:hypothetical protein